MKDYSDLMKQAPNPTATYEGLKEVTYNPTIGVDLEEFDINENDFWELWEVMTESERREIDVLLKTAPARALMPHQIVPWGKDWWDIFMLIGGRGVGKTVAGVFACREHLHALGPKARIGVAAPTNADARDVCAEGEALALDTPIPTPDGWTIMGLIKKGDVIYDQNGEVQKVNIVSDIKYDRPCYRVTFDDNSTIITDEKHKWLTYTKTERAARYRSKTKHCPKVRTTKEILDSLFADKPNELNHAVANCGPIDCDRKHFEIHPYLLGVWLGDGLSKSGAIVTMDEDILARIESLGYELTVWADDRSGQASTFGVLGLRKKLRLAGLLRNKHIPEEYFRGSFGQRIDLIKGLMDTDGYVSDRGQCSFDNTNLEIVEGLKDLLQSCGIKVGRIQAKSDSRKNSYKTIYRITFTPGLEVFSLGRKSERQIVPAKNTEYRFVKSIELIESVPVKCIAVSGPSKLYLAGKSYIPTHNTGLLTMFPHEFVKYNRSLGEARHVKGGLVKFMGTEKPAKWNGPQWSMLWADELSLCNEKSINDAQLGLRLGPKTGPHRARMIATLTPKNKKWVKAISKHRTTFVPQYYDELTNKLRLPTTYDNIFLPERRVEWLREKFGNSRLGRQELLGEFIDDVAGALWSRNMIRYVEDVEQFKKIRFLKIVVAVDPAGSRARAKADENSLTEEQKQNQAKNADTGIAVVGYASDRKYYVLYINSGQWSPEEWGSEAIRCFHKFRADKIVAERNFGGDMVEYVIKSIEKFDKKMGRQLSGRHIPVKLVTASKGKDIRANPVVSLYEQAKVLHTISFGPAEDQMCSFVDADDNEGADMVDALVWAFIEIMGLGGTENNRIIITSPYEQMRDFVIM